MEPEENKVLIVDDDVDFLKLVEDVLEFENYRIFKATSANQALNLVKENTFSLVLLDIMLPDADGYTVCKQIRAISSVPVIMVTGKVTQEDKIIGLDAGADDYITKPFYPGEFCARVRAAVRRQTYPEGRRPFRCDDLVVDFKSQTVTLGGQAVDLSMTEFRLLAYLAQNANRVVSVDEILSEVWGRNGYDRHVVTVTIGRIRQKLQDNDLSKYIQNRPGRGYVIYGN